MSASCFLPSSASSACGINRSPTGEARPVFRVGRSSSRAFTFIEIVAAMMVTVILGVIATGGFLMSQKIASASRIRTQARIVLQRNIDLALSIPFSSTSTPPMFQVTSEPAPGVRYNELDMPASNNGQVPLLLKPDGTPFLTGTLWRSVTAQTTPNPANAVIRKITFTVTYNYLGAEQQLSLSTLRARDDQ